MKPVAIFRHFHTEGPGHFATFLDHASIPWRLIKVDRGEPVPGDPCLYSGLAFMGGPMSANDNLPWIEAELGLIQSAAQQDIPVVGHCLGGQLMAKALGAAVTRNPVKEIGWGKVFVTDPVHAQPWLGGLTEFDVFHWHGETFSIPPGASRILSSAHCENQAFVLGRHFAMQCHVEMTEDLVRSWCDTGLAEIQRNPGPAVQEPAAMQANLAERIELLHGIAEKIYQRWVAGLSMDLREESAAKLVGRA